MQIDSELNSEGTSSHLILGLSYDDSSVVVDTSITGSRKRKMNTSPVWNYFERLVDKPNFASCIICGANYQHSSNTSNLGKV